MNILYVTVSYESVQKHLYEMMLQKRHHMSIFLYGIVKCHHPKEISNDMVVYIPEWKYVRGPVFYLLRMFLIAKQCLKKTQLDNVDILHGNMSFRDGLICRYIMKHKGIPYVVSFRDTDLEMYRKWKLPWIRFACNNVLKDAEQIVFLSNTYRNKLLDSLSDKLKRIVKSKSCVIPNGIDDYFLQNIGTNKSGNFDRIEILSVGKICKRKNPETTIEAIKILRESGVDCKLTLIGEIEDINYKDLIIRNEFVTYVEPSPKEIIIKYMRKADVFIVPSRTETFGLVYAEAMSQGLPVIYSRGQGFDGQFENGFVGYSVDCNNPKEIALRVRDILDNYSEISKNCITESLRYNWNQITDKYIKIYENIISNKMCY